MNEELKIFRRPNEEITKKAKDLNLCLDFLKLPVSSFTKEEIEACGVKISKLKDRMEDLEKKSSEETWLEELNELRETLTK